MIPQSLKPFVNRLRQETDSGNVKWVGGAENSFFANHGAYTVYLSYSFDDDRELSVYKMSVTHQGQEAWFAVTSDEYDIQDMRDLYGSVTVSAAGFGNLATDFFK
ncbi:hypothetical protein F4693_000677 [Sphingomonas endophytica]|uniref:Uncharacterized protein n=1 Tax=Sphingomonas endophytica TaxID=869719 RepID=A0A7X0JBB3_9SPHN|nr:hypothetical protein [Sphingomonas endophytica]